ncbi:MAG: HEPN domain-containing protein [Candidatus Helarchaeota archaeon]
MTSDLLKDFALKLIQEAESGFESAKTQLRESRFHKCVFESQQCVEKLMKAALALEGLTQVFDHDPSALFASEIMTRANNEYLEQLRKMLRETDWLMDQYPFVRYARLRSQRVVSPLDRYEEKHARSSIQIAENAIKIIKNFLKGHYGLDISE